MKVFFEFQPGERESLEKVKLVIDTLLNGEETKPAQETCVASPVQTQRRGKLTDEEKKQRQKEYMIKYWQKRHEKEDAENETKIKARSPIVKPGSSYCQNPYCIEHENHTPLDKSKMVEYKGLNFCTQECLDDYKENEERKEE